APRHEIGCRPERRAMAGDEHGGSQDERAAVAMCLWPVAESGPCPGRENRPMLLSRLWSNARGSCRGGAVPGEWSGALTRCDRPVWIDWDFQHLLYTLGCAGYGWLRPEGVRQIMEQMAREWQGPPPLPSPKEPST